MVVNFLKFQYLLAFNISGCNLTECIYIFYLSILIIFNIKISTTSSIGFCKIIEKLYTGNTDFDR